MTSTVSYISNLLNWALYLALNSLVSRLISASKIGLVLQGINLASLRLPMTVLVELLRIRAVHKYKMPSTIRELCQETAGKRQGKAYECLEILEAAQNTTKINSMTVDNMAEVADSAEFGFIIWQLMSVLKPKGHATDIMCANGLGITRDKFDESVTEVLSSIYLAKIQAITRLKKEEIERMEERYFSDLLSAQYYIRCLHGIDVLVHLLTLASIELDKRPWSATAVKSQVPGKVSSAMLVLQSGTQLVNQLELLIGNETDYKTRDTINKLLHSHRAAVNRYLVQGIKEMDQMVEITLINVEGTGHKRRHRELASRVVKNLERKPKKYQTVKALLELIVLVIEGIYLVFINYVLAILAGTSTLGSFTDETIKSPKEHVGLWILFTFVMCWWVVISLVGQITPHRLVMLYLRRLENIIDLKIEEFIEESFLHNILPLNPIAAIFLPPQDIHKKMAECYAVGEASCLRPGWVTGAAAFSVQSAKGTGVNVILSYGDDINVNKTVRAMQTLTPKLQGDADFDNRSEYEWIRDEVLDWM